MKTKQQQLTLIDKENFSLCNGCEVRKMGSCAGESVVSFGGGPYCCDNDRSWEDLEKVRGSSIDSCNFEQTPLNLPDFLIQVDGPTWDTRLRGLLLPFDLFYDEKWKKIKNFQKRFNISKGCLWGLSFLGSRWSSNALDLLDWKEISYNLKKFSPDFILGAPYKVLGSNPVLKNNIHIKKSAMFNEFLSQEGFNTIPYVSFASTIDIDRVSGYILVNGIKQVCFDLSTFEKEYRSRENLSNSIDVIRSFIEKSQVEKFYVANCNYTRILQLLYEFGNLIGFIDWKAYKNARFQKDIFNVSSSGKVSDIFLKNLIQLDKIRDSIDS